MEIILFRSSWDSEIQQYRSQGGGLFSIRLIVLIAALALGGDVPLCQSQQADSAIGAFKDARAFSVDPFGNIYVIDGGTSELLKYGPDGTLLEKTGGYGWEQGTFDRPADIATPNGLDVYVADYGNHRIQRFDRNLNFVSTYSTRQEEEQPIMFGYPRSVAVSRFGSIFIVDGENKRIVKLTQEGSIEKVFGDIGSGAGKLSSPWRIRISSDDRVYVVDGNTVAVFDIFGNYLNRLGRGSFLDVRTLAVDQQRVHILDSCKMVTLEKEHSEKEYSEKEHSIVPHHPLEHIQGQLNSCEVIDMQFLGDVLYVLTRHQVQRHAYQEEDTR